MIADALDEAEAVTSDSPHLCRSTRPLDPKTLAVPVLAPINQWGALPDRHSSLSPHGQSRRTRDLLAGDIVGAPGHPAFAATNPNPKQRRRPEHHRRVRCSTGPPPDRAWVKRRNDLDQLGDVGDVLTDSTGRSPNSSNASMPCWIPRRPDRFAAPDEATERPAGGCLPAASVSSVRFMIMATVTRTFLVDDLNGSTDDVSTVQFHLDKTSYEIDLTATNQEPPI